MKYLLLILSLAAITHGAQAEMSEERQAMYEKIFAMTPEERTDYFGSGGHGRPADSRGNQGGRPEGAGGGRPESSYGNQGGRPEGAGGGRPAGSYGNRGGRPDGVSGRPR